MSIRLRVISAVLAAAALAVAVGACDRSEPQDLTFDVVIADDAWNLADEIIKVKQGDHVTFNIESDVRGGFHLHGYDLFSEVAPGEPASFDFTADATGNFEIMLHRFTLASDMAAADGGHGNGGGHGEMDDDGTTENPEVRLGWFQVYPR